MREMWSDTVWGRGGPTWECGIRTLEHSLRALHRARALTWPLDGRSVLGTIACAGIASEPQLGAACSHCIGIDFVY